MTTRVEALATRTADAYSYDRYGPKAWRNAITKLIRLGYSDADIELILRSKYMRWAADAYGKVVDEEEGTERITGGEIIKFYMNRGINMLLLQANG